MMTKETTAVSNTNEEYNVFSEDTHILKKEDGKRIMDYVIRADLYPYRHKLQDKVDVYFYNIGFHYVHMIGGFDIYDDKGAIKTAMHEFVFKLSEEDSTLSIDDVVRVLMLEVEHKAPPSKVYEYCLGDVDLAHENFLSVVNGIRNSLGAIDD